MAAHENNSTNNSEQPTVNFTPTDTNKVWLETILRKQSRNDEITKIVQYKSKKATSKGDNYTSDLTRVTMDVVIGSGKSKQVSLVIKELPATEFKRAAFGEMGIFLKEIMMYRDILPNMSEIMHEFNDYSELLWGKCLDYRPYDRIVLEDLTTTGYKMNDRRLGLDYTHCKLVMKSLAKFHAISVVMRERRLIPMEVFEYTLLQRKENRQQLGQVYKKVLENFTNTIDESWESNWKPVADRIRTLLLPDIMGKLSELLERDDTRFNVLNHGDCWLNNIMFKYGIDSETPISVKFVDFQLCFYNTPAYDLQYLLSTTPSYEVRTEYKWELIEVYHKYLTKFLNDYNYKGNIITFEALKEEMTRLCLFTVLNGLLLLPLIMLENVEHVPDMETMIKEHVETQKLSVDWLPKGGERFTKYMKLLMQEAVDSKKV